jgi:hypothetical protein
MVFCFIFVLGNHLSSYNLVMNFQSLGARFLKGSHQQGIQICDNLHLSLL